MLDERSNGPKVICPVTGGDLTGPLDRRAGMAAGKAQEALEYSHPLDAAGLDHRLGPVGTFGPQPGGHPFQDPCGATLDRADLLRGDVLGWSAEPARLVPGVHGDLLHPLIEDPHQAAIPPHPDFSRPVLWRRRVVGPLDLDMAVAVHRAATFVVRRERLERQR